MVDLFKSYKKKIEGEYGIKIVRSSYFYKSLYNILKRDMFSLSDLAKKGERYSIRLYFLNKLRKFDVLITDNDIELNSYFTERSLWIKYYKFSSFIEKHPLLLLQKYLLNDFIFLSIVANHQYFLPWGCKTYAYPDFKSFVSPIKKVDKAIFTINFDDKFIFSHRKQFLNDYDILNWIIVKEFEEGDIHNFIVPFGKHVEELNTINLYYDIDKFLLIKEFDPFKYSILKSLYKVEEKKPITWLT